MGVGERSEQGSLPTIVSLETKYAALIIQFLVAFEKIYFQARRKMYNSIFHREVLIMLTYSTRVSVCLSERRSIHFV